MQCVKLWVYDSSFPYHTLFSVSSLSTFGFTFPYFHFRITAYFLLLAALSLIIFLSDFLSSSYLNYEFNNSYFSPTHSHLAKCIFFFTNWNRDKKFTCIHDSPLAHKWLSFLFFLTYHHSLLKSSHLSTLTSVYIVWIRNDTLLFMYRQCGSKDI